jgi:hypothetical protein
MICKRRYGTIRKYGTILLQSKLKIIKIQNWKFFFETWFYLQQQQQAVREQQKIVL